MLKISPITKNNKLLNHLQTKKKNFVSTSLLTLSLLSPITMSNCAKPIIDIEEDTFEKKDTTYTNDNNSNMNIIIDSLNKKEYTFYL